MFCFTSEQLLLTEWLQVYKTKGRGRVSRGGGKASDRLGHPFAYVFCSILLHVCNTQYFKKICKKVQFLGEKSPTYTTDCFTGNPSYFETTCTVTPSCYAHLSRGFESKTYTAKFEMQIEKPHIPCWKQLFSPHLLLYRSISGINPIKGLMQKCEFFSKQDGQRLCSRETMLVVSQST